MTDPVGATSAVDLLYALLIGTVVLFSVTGAALLAVQVVFGEKLERELGSDGRD